MKNKLHNFLEADDANLFHKLFHIQGLHREMLNFEHFFLLNYSYKCCYEDMFLF